MRGKRCRGSWPTCFNTVVYGELFATAAPVLATLIWVFPITALSGHARWGLIAAGRQRDVLVAEIAGSVTMLGVGILLIPQLKAVGGAMAIVSSSLVVWGVTHTFAAKYVNRLPLLGPSLYPGLLAVLGAGLGYTFGASPWQASAIGAGLFGLSTLWVASQLMADFRQLARAKADIEPHARLLPGNVS